MIIYLTAAVGAVALLAGSVFITCHVFGGALPTWSRMWRTGYCVMPPDGVRGKPRWRE